MDLPFEVDAEDGDDLQTLAASVLIVDDEAVVRDVFVRLLSREADLAVSVAESAEAGIGHLSERRFDLLITDKNLPGMGGIELIAQARQMRPAIEAIMITGYASAESVIAAMAAGASDYLVKPFEDLTVVRAKVRAAIERRQSRVRGREKAKNAAKEAAALLAKGKSVGDPVWDALEAQLREYERASRTAAGGKVALIGGEPTAAALREEGFEVVRASEAPAGVVVLDTARADWRKAAADLTATGADVLLLARPDADLADLLEAIALRLDLVGFGTKAPAHGPLAARVRSALTRRSVERAQEKLSAALDAFRAALAKP